ncbi:unnamed protein product [Schistocephalus solidus]|uniref:Secreted protein n=1 Tax=Schistocephalus solidus TaxID=70667 RepID=A0A183SMK6_SCHSO|nr:unnamed protein product [Schistocephalus solidus]
MRRSFGFGGADPFGFVNCYSWVLLVPSLSSLSASITGDVALVTWKGTRRPASHVGRSLVWCGWRGFLLVHGLIGLAPVLPPQLYYTPKAAEVEVISTRIMSAPYRRCVTMTSFITMN